MGCGSWGHHRVETGEQGIGDARRILLVADVTNSERCSDLRADVNVAFISRDQFSAIGTAIQSTTVSSHALSLSEPFEAVRGIAYDVLLKEEQDSDRIKRRLCGRSADHVSHHVHDARALQALVGDCRDHLGLHGHGPGGLGQVLLRGLQPGQTQ